MPSVLGESNLFQTPSTLHCTFDCKIKTHIVISVIIAPGWGAFIATTKISKFRPFFIKVHLSLTYMFLAYYSILDFYSD